MKIEPQDEQRRILYRADDGRAYLRCGIILFFVFLAHFYHLFHLGVSVIIVYLLHILHIVAKFKFSERQTGTFFKSNLLYILYVYINLQFVKVII